MTRETCNWLNAFYYIIYNNKMSDSLINQITLDCLMNKKQYAKYVSAKISKSINKTDKKFYRKRIINLAREMIVADDISLNILNVLPDVKYAFDNYVNSCIHYFKLLDTNDIVQDEYKDYNFQKDELMKEANETLENHEINDLVNVDNLLAREIKLPSASLNSFVKKKQKGPMFIPQQKEIDLSNPVLKNKGIVKKKNKNIVYE